MKRFAAGAFLLAVVVAGPASAEIVPYEAIRSLQQLQDQIAVGNTIAQAAHAKAIERTSRAFTKAGLTVWADPRNARALVLYLFSGGNASAISLVVPPTALPPEVKTLYEGALAYGLGDDEKARVALMPIDAKTLPSGVGGHLALVQATLCADNDRAKAIVLLDLARLLEPGTLIEEAALRKEMSLIGSTGDLEKFMMLARRYLGTFAQSVYAENFRQLVALTAMQIGSADSDEAALRLSKLAANLEKDERRRLYLAIAREAVLAGHTRMAARAADEAGRLAPPSGPDAARALVYFGAAAIVGDRYDLGRKALAAVADDRLSVNDRALHASAIAVAEMIRRPARLDKSGRPEAAHATVIADGERSLASADEMLKKIDR